MSYPSWQKRCGEVNGYDHEAKSTCHIPLRDLEHELSLVDGFLSDWLYEAAAYSDCALKLAMKSFNRWGVMANHKRKKPANDNGMES